jgi:hypothetical protein
MRGGEALRNQEQGDHQAERKLKALELLQFELSFEDLRRNRLQNLQFHQTNK